MLNSSVIEGTNIVTATYSGSLGTEQMEQLRDQLSSVVADHDWVSRLVNVVDAAATPFDLRVFPIDRRDDAVAWLST